MLLSLQLSYVIAYKIKEFSQLGGAASTITPEKAVKVHTSLGAILLPSTYIAAMVTASSEANTSTRLVASTSGTVNRTVLPVLPQGPSGEEVALWINVKPLIARETIFLES